MKQSMKNILPFLVLVITVSCSAIAPLPNFTPTKTPSPQSSSFTQLKYPNHESCKIQVDTQKWEITDEGKKSIANSIPVPISYKLGVGGKQFVKHKSYDGCMILWITAGYRGTGIQKSMETINGKSWEVWFINELSYKIYSWAELKEIQFVQNSPLEIPQKESCQSDIYEILGSLQCE